MPGDLTAILHALRDGDRSAADDLARHVMAELRSLAQGCLRRGRPSETLQPTALLDAAFMKLIDQTRVDIRDRGHFFSLAAKVMRQLLVDHARERAARKRGGGRRAETLDEAFVRSAGIEVELLDLHDALDELAKVDEREARVVELRYFAGLDLHEVADVLDVSLATAERDWRSARAWLVRRLRPPR